MEQAIQYERFFIHLLVKDDAGPIHSGTALGAFPVGTVSRWRFACGDAAAVTSDVHRATVNPRAVRCDACKATEEFKTRYRPLRKHGVGVEMIADGCCG